VLRIPDIIVRDPGSDFYPSQISDPGSQIPGLGSWIQEQQEKRWGKKFAMPFVVFYKILLFIFKQVPKKFEPIDKEI
jgi:hypothetical protein